MFEIRVPLHSVVDVITNSSSVIYTEATSGAVNLVKDIINEILARGGSDKTADDLFSIYATSNEGYYDYGDGVPRDLVIEPLDGTDTQLVYKLKSLFDTQEYFNG